MPLVAVNVAGVVTWGSSGVVLSKNIMFAPLAETPKILVACKYSPVAISFIN